MKWLKKNWKSTLGGVLTLSLVGLRAYQNPGILADPQTLAVLASGLTLIGLNESGSTKPPR